MLLRLGRKRGGGGINVRAVTLLFSAQLGLPIDLWKTTHVFSQGKIHSARLRLLRLTEGVQRLYATLFFFNVCRRLTDLTMWHFEILHPLGRVVQRRVIR